MLEDRKDSRSLFAPGANPSNLVYSESHPMSRYIAVDNNGKFYHSGESGYYFTGLTEVCWMQNYGSIKFI